MNERSDRKRSVVPFVQAFLEQVPALIVLPAWSGIASGFIAAGRGRAGEAETASGSPCGRCAECTARFCRHQAEGRR